MDVLVLTPYPYGVTPGPRSSIELWEKILEPADIHLHYAPFMTAELEEVVHERGRHMAKATRMVEAYRRRILGLRGLSDFDAVLVYREAALVGPAWIERWVAKRKPIIYQLDDPLYVPYRSPFSGYLSYLKFFGKVATICRLSRVVIVNSRHHREYASRYSSNVVEVPSVVDEDVYRRREKPVQADEVCVGWSGSPSTIANLDMIAAPLRELARDPAIRLSFIGASESPIPSLPCEVVPWKAETEVADLARLDVGLLPVPLNEWNKRKFFLKLAQYMALGIPAVATPLGSVPDVLEPGVTGFWANTQEEWRDRVMRLVSDPELRQAMGDAAVEVARRRFTLQANTEKIVSAFQSAIR
jgi:glycosyltransferase involved in cell wall biosynthesis